MKTTNSSDNGCLTWLNDNLARPAQRAFIEDAYEPVRTIVNVAARATVGQSLLPQIKVAVTTGKPAKEFSPEYFAQLTSSAVVSVACYAVAGETTGGLMRGCAQAAQLEGAAARLMASQSTAQILGGAIHDGLMEAPDNRSRLGHALLGAVSMAAFEKANHCYKGQNFVNRYAALALTGGILSATEVASSQAMAGEPISWSAIGSTATAGATVSALLPGAQWGLGRIVDVGNVYSGRGIPAARYVDYNALAGQSTQLDDLMHDYPLVRVQPQRYSGSHIEYQRSLVHLGAGSAAPDLAHELGHLRARVAVEPQFLTAAALLKTNEELASSLFMKARFNQEKIARQIEQRTEYDISGRKDAAHDADFASSDYQRLFSAEFEKFRTTSGAYRPEHDFALVPSAQRARLRDADDPRATIETLYAEMTAGEKRALVQALEEWKVDEGKKRNAFDLTWGLKRSGWAQALTASVAERCAARLLFSHEGANDAAPNHPLADKLTSELSAPAKRFSAAEQQNFDSRRAAFAQAGREHEFWEKEYETATKRFRVAEEIAHPQLIRSENQIMDGWARIAASSPGLPATSPVLDPHARERAENRLMIKQDELNQNYEDTLFPYRQQREIVIYRLNRQGYDVEDLNPYVFESASTHAVLFDERPWLQAQAEFAKTFREVVEKVSEQKELTADVNGELRLPPHVVRKALVSALLYGKDAYRWWQDRAFWRPAVPIDVPLVSTANLNGLGSFITKHRDSADEHVVQRVAQAWPKMQVGERSRLSYSKLSEATAVAAKYAYPQAKNQALATEAFKWGLSAGAYNECEELMLEAATVPDAFPTGTTWRVGHLRGRFLERSDPRILFLGEHTNSCIRLGGANEDGLKWTLRSPVGGLFVVEDVKSGALVAASRVWKVPQFSGVTFNNVESKGLGTRDEDVLSIYRSAAKHLIHAGEATVVTMGVGHNDLRIDNLDELDLGLPLPENYVGLNDSNVHQVLLAGHPEEELYANARRKTSQEHVLGEYDPHAVDERDPHTLDERDPHAVDARDPHAVDESDPHAVDERDPHVLGESDPHALDESDRHAYDAGNILGQVLQQRDLARPYILQNPLPDHTHRLGSTLRAQSQPD